MSSILEALKKVERESAVGDGQNAPLPGLVLPVNRTVDRPRRWLLWIPLGSIAVLFFMASVFWLARLSTPDPQPVVTKRVIEPIAAAKLETRSVVSPDPQTPSPIRRKIPEDPSPTPPARSPQNKTVSSEAHDASSIKSPSQSESPPSVSSEVRPAFIKPPQSEVKPGQTPEDMTASIRPPQSEPLPGVTPEARPAFIPPPQGESRPNVTPEDMTASITPPQAESRPTMTTETRPPSTAPAPQPSEGSRQTNRKKVFRTDDRIDLQALVWAPEAADRFVVINNLLLKEGGAIDNITVLRINPDDVLLSDGSDRWHQEFKIR